jgi:surface antigen
MRLTDLSPAMMRSWARQTLAVGLALACSVASAAGWVAVLKNSAAESFQEEDLRLFLDTAVKTLDSDGPRDPVDWSNPATGAGGSFRVVGDAPAVNGAPCRRLRVSVYAPKYQKSTSTWTVCKSAEGRWRLASVG